MTHPQILAAVHLACSLWAATVLAIAANAFARLSKGKDGALAWTICCGCLSAGMAMGAFIGGLQGF